MERALSHAVTGGAVAALIAAPTIDEQAAIWRRSFAPSRRRSANGMAARDLIWRLVMPEPAAAFLPGARAVGERINRDFERAAGGFLFRDSDIATLVLRGRHQAQGALPIHLHPENYERVRTSLPRLRMVEGGLADLARLDVGACDGFSLSDFGSYCGPDDYAACWQGVLATAAPDALFCERIFMNEMIPSSPRVRIDRGLSDRLSAIDRSIIYRVRAGTIEPAPR